jgi:hypothetical protein
MRTFSMIAVVAALVAATSAHAQTNWTGTVSSDWFIAGNWNAGVPTGATNANIDTVTPNPTVVAAPNATAQNLAVGQVGTGVLTIQTGGTVSNVSGAVGNCGLHSTYYPFAKHGGGSRCRSVAAASAKTAVTLGRLRCTEEHIV